MANSLYISYFSIREPLVQTQVIPYLLEIIKGQNEVSLLTFEPDLKTTWKATDIHEARLQLAKKGINWHLLPYHKWPSAPATAWDTLRGIIYVRRLLKGRKLDVLHCRVHVPALIGACSRRLSRQKPKLLFDIRGFFPEEYVDAGIWSEDGSVFRTVKRVERWLVQQMDGFVVLTEAARNILFPESVQSGYDRKKRPVEVIPCCVDFASRFKGDQTFCKDEIRSELNLNGRFVIAHLGALGGLYLTDKIADLLAASKAKDPSTFALFLTQSDPNLIVPLLEERGFDRSDYLVTRVPTEKVPKYLASADVGLSFVKATFATQSRSPTKIAEYLACGIPLIANSGVGDVDNLIRTNKVGVLVEEFSGTAYNRAISEVRALGNISDLCRITARREFDLQTVGGTRYRRIYSRLLSQ
jgi:glycosyltransferase involved in cell wall biosynthesis